MVVSGPSKSWLRARGLEDVTWVNERLPEHTSYAVNHRAKLATWLTEAEYRALVEAGASVDGKGVAS